MKGNKKLVAIIASVVAVFIVVILVIMAMKSARATELSPHATEDGKEMIESLKAEESKAEPKAEPSKAESKVAESKTEPSVAKADSTDAPKETTLEDPYGMYVVTEEWLKEHGGYAVERNGKLYAFYSQYGVMGGVPENYSVGYEFSGRGLQWTYLYLSDDNSIKDIPTGLSGRSEVSAGDFPIFKVSKKEEVRVYNKNVLDEIELSTANFYGYTLNATHINGSYRPVIDYEVTAERGIVGAKKPSVCDTNDQPVADVYDLEYGKEYKYNWFKGTEYHEMTVKADSQCYAVNKNRIQVPVELSKKGYAVMDISGLAPGTYCWQKSVFELID